MRALYSCVVAMALSSCAFQTAADYMDLELSNGLDAQRIDLNPLTASVGIDNTVVVDLSYQGAAPEAGQGSLQLEPVNFSQYRIDFRVDGEPAPYLAGAINVRIQPGETLAVIMPAVGPAQLSWVADRMSGEEFAVEATLQLAGVSETKLDSPEVVILGHEFKAIFADYE